MSFVVSEGAVRGLSRPDLPGVPRLQLSDSLSMTYKEIWKKQPAVRTAVSFLGRNIAQLGLHASAGSATPSASDSRPRAPLLIGKPNPWTTRYRMLDALVQTTGHLRPRVLAEGEGVRRQPRAGPPPARDGVAEG
ncbi:hypothetical protein GS917_25115 [Rhodococcus hoagii]|nr:hypothetical protein [Prescottella equi]